MLSETKQIGTMGEMLAIADLMRQGWDVFTSVGDCSHVDLVALKGDRIVRIQVKTNSNTSEKDVAVGAFGKITSRRGVRYEVGEFDVLAVVALDRKRVAYVPFTEDMYGSSVHLRFAPTKNGQQKHIRMFADYETLA